MIIKTSEIHLPESMTTDAGKGPGPSLHMAGLSQRRVSRNLDIFSTSRVSIDKVTPQSSDFPYCRSEATEREWAFFRALVQARVERDAANKIIYVTCPKCGHRQKSPALVLNELCFRCGKNYNRQTGEETGGRYVQMTDAQIEKYEADLRRLEVENKRRREEAENARHIASLAATGARVVQEPPNYAEPAKGKKK